MSKIVRDNIYGLIKLDDDEVKAINHPLFQRLRRIRQNGLLEYVYPSATHNRFQHSLGMLHLMKFALDYFKETDVDFYNKNILKNEDGVYVGKELKWAALLHDIGHYPLSHTCERAAHDDHEIMSAWILKNTSISKCIPEDVDINSVCALITGQSLQLGKGIYSDRPSFASQLIKSPIDLDRMDYLLRDAYNTGVPYCSMGYEYLIQSFTICPEKKMLCIKRKAVPAADSMELSRVQMYTGVYSHKVVDSYTRMVADVYQRCDDIFPDKDNLRKNNEEFFENFDDYWLRAEFKKVAHENKGIAGRYADMLLHRRHLKLTHYKSMWEDKTLLERPGSQRMYEDLVANIKSKNSDCPIDNNLILAGNFPIDYSEIAPNLTLRPALTDPENEMKTIHVMDFNTKSIKRLVDCPESVSRHLGGKTLKINRVFTVPEHQKELQQYMDDKCKEKNILIE